MTLRYLDVRWSNICNLKCRSCSATYSSSWAKEDGKKNVYIFAGGENNDKLFADFEKHFDTIEEFYFAGGEPLLMDTHYKILDYLISNGKHNVKLRYNTNLTSLKYKGKSITHYWKQFSNVQVFASLDHYGERAEYIREGTDWKTVEQNLQEIKLETPHVDLQVSTVVSVFNVSTLTDFIDYLLDNLFNIDKFKPQFYNIINPEYYSFDVIENKQEIINKLKEKTYNKHIDQQLNNVVNALTSSQYNDTLYREFRYITDMYDIKRNQNFLTTFPELELVGSR
jgi:MoaA/NifB/PqqE/SkfB family radical SAM enzyme